MAYTKAPDPTAILKEKLKAKGAMGGAWLLCGEEMYLAMHYRAQVREKLIPDPDMGYFDHIHLSGRKTGGVPLSASVATAIASLPVMNECKLIEISEPAFSDMEPSELKALCEVLSSLGDYPHATVLMLCAEEEFPSDFRARRSEIWLSLEKAGVHIIPFEKQSEAKLMPWCHKHFTSEGIAHENGVIEAMIGRVGTSMTALAAEMAKLTSYAKANGKQSVSPEDVALVCSTTEESADFGIPSAVRARDTQALMREFTVLKQQKAEPMLLFFQISAAISELYHVKLAAEEGYVREDIVKMMYKMHNKMKEYPVKLNIAGAQNYSLEALSRLMRLCAETDLALKSAAGEPYLLVERLICSISRRCGI